MKKLISVCMVIILSFLLLTACDLMSDASIYYTERAEVDGFSIEINRRANRCFVGEYDCTEYTENMEIVIPDTYEGIPITKLGGYYGTGVPTPFRISLEDIYMNAEAGSEYDSVFGGNIDVYEIEEEYYIEDVEFILNIGKNISEVESVIMDDYYPHINEDGSITFYHPVVNIVCSEDNKHFYSEDGKLYSKETDELITDFSYKEDNE